jgi:hypothetical protein
MKTSLIIVLLVMLMILWVLTTAIEVRGNEYLAFKIRTLFYFTVITVSFILGTIC